MLGEPRPGIIVKNGSLEIIAVRGCLFWPKEFSFLQQPLHLWVVFLHCGGRSRAEFVFLMSAYLRTEKCHSEGNFGVNPLLSPVFSLTRMIPQTSLEQADRPTLTSLRVSGPKESTGSY